MEDVQMCAIVVALVALVRAQWPQIDGKAFVFGIAVVVGEALVWLNGGSVETWRATTIRGLIIALTAAGGMQALAYAGRKVGQSIPPPRGFSAVSSLLTVSAACAVAVLIGLLCGGCAGSFEEARLAGRTPAALQTRAQQPSDYCQSLDGKQMAWHAVAAGAGALSGASGLTAIPVGGDARIGLIAGSVTLSAGAALAVVLADSASTSWARACSEQPAGVR